MTDQSEATDKPAPRITIGVMTRNYARFLPTALESVISQDMPDWELVIADDASTDETAEVVRPYLSDRRITYVRHPQALGQAGNWTFCLNWGSAPIVAVLHADDAYLPGTLMQVTARFADDPDLDLFYGNFERVSTEEFASRTSGRLAWNHSSDRRSGTDTFFHLMAYNHCLPSASFMRRELVARCGVPDPELRMIVDIEFTRRAALGSRVAAWTNTPLTRYRTHTASTSVASHANGTLASELVGYSDRLFANILREPGLRNRVASDQLQPLIAKTRINQGHSLSSLAVSEAIKGRMNTARTVSRQGWKMASNLKYSPKALVDRFLIEVGARGVLRALHFRRLG